MMLGAVMQQGWNGLDLGKALEERSAAIAQTLPLGMTLAKVSDQAVNINEAVGEFMMKFAMALGVVLLVSLLSLGWRVGIVVAAAVPLTLAVVFLIMLETGRFFDRITLGALILALGLLVDDAIIAIEVMVVKMEEGMDRIKAAAYAWSHTAAPMLSGTLVTVIGFMPVGFASSKRRRVCRQHLLGRGLRADRVLDRRGGLHALSRRQDACPRSSRLKAGITPSTTRRIIGAYGHSSVSPCATSS